MIWPAQVHFLLSVVSEYLCQKLLSLCLFCVIVVYSVSIGFSVSATFSHNSWVATLLLWLSVCYRPIRLIWPAQIQFLLLIVILISLIPAFVLIYAYLQASHVIPSFFFLFTRIFSFFFFGRRGELKKIISVFLVSLGKASWRLAEPPIFLFRHHTKDCLHFYRRTIMLTGARCCFGALISPKRILTLP